MTGGAAAPLRPAARCGTRRGRAAAAPSAGRGPDAPGNPRRGGKRIAKRKETGKGSRGRPEVGGEGGGKKGKGEGEK